MGVARWTIRLAILALAAPPAWALPPGPLPVVVESGVKMVLRDGVTLIGRASCRERVLDHV